MNEPRLKCPGPHIAVKSADNIDADSHVSLVTMKSIPPPLKLDVLHKQGNENKFHPQS